MLVLDAFEGLQSVAVGQIEVQDDGVDPPLRQPAEPVAEAAGGLQVEGRAERLLEERAHQDCILGGVLDQEDPEFARCDSGRLDGGRRMLFRVQIQGIPY